jgi:hypothetical protein
VYSCILLNNEHEFEKEIDGVQHGFNWRGKYNEDIDLSLRYLKNGYTNLEFRNILSDKKCSGTVKGGNTDSIYKDQSQETPEMKKQMGYKMKVDYLIKQHPDVKIKYKKLKSKEYHHNVDYTPWENNRLIPIESPIVFKPFEFVEDDLIISVPLTKQLIDIETKNYKK